jgi:surface protein
MSITKPFINKFLSLLLVLSVVLAGLLPSTAVYASEVNTPGSGKSIAELTADGLIMDVTVPTNVLIYVDEHGEVTTPDYLPIINNSVAPVFVHSLSVTPKNGWTLDPTNTDYTNFKVNQKNYWIAFNGLDPSNGPIALATPINGSDSLNLVLSADVAPQRTAVSGLNIGEILITFDWDAAEGAQDPIDPEIPGDEDDQEPVIPPDTEDFTVGDVYHKYVDGYGDYVYIPLLTGGVGNYRIIIADKGTDPETQALVNEVIYKKSEESCTPGVLLPGYNPELSYDVYVTYVDGEESETIMKVLSPKEVDPDINFEVHSVNHGSEGTIEFHMTVEAPTMVSYAMLPAGSQPPQNGTSSFSLDYAGTQTRGVEIYGGYDNSIDYDIYIWVYDAEWNPVGPVKVLLAAYGSGTGDDGSGSGDDGTGTGDGGYEHEGVIPEGYTLATDEDFSGTRDGEFRYIGSKPYVVVPHVIKGVPVTSYYSMFANTDVKGVASDNMNITDMSNMFANSTSETLDLTYFDTSSVTNMSSMFQSAKATTLDLSNFDTSSVTDMSQMFASSQATTIDVSNFDTSNVTNMRAMFIWSKATTLDLSNFDTSSVTNMHAMFREAEATTLDVSNFDTSSVTDMSFMFSQSKATTLDVSNFDTSSVTNMSSMFQSAKATTLDVSNFDTSKVTNMGNMFYGVEATTLDVSNFDTSNVTNMRGMFSRSEATSLDLSNFDTSKVTNMGNMFNGVKATTLDVSNFDTSSVTDMSFMFAWSKATTLDLSNFDTSNVTDMREMFREAEATTLDLSNFDTSNVTDMNNMFREAEATTIDVSNFDTSSVTNMSSMFYGAKATTLDLSNFDTRNVTDMSEMFREAEATTIDVSNFDTSSVTDMSYMFNGAKATTIDISSFNLADTQPTVLGMLYAQATTVYVRSQADIDYIIANHGTDLPETLNFVIK